MRIQFGEDLQYFLGSRHLVRYPTVSGVWSGWIVRTEAWPLRNRKPLQNAFNDLCGDSPRFEGRDCSGPEVLLNYSIIGLQLCLPKLETQYFGDKMIKIPVRYAARTVANNPSKVIIAYLVNLNLMVSLLEPVCPRRHNE